MLTLFLAALLHLIGPVSFDVSGGSPTGGGPTGGIVQPNDVSGGSPTG